MHFLYHKADFLIFWSSWKEGKNLNKDNNGRIVQGKPSLPYSLQKTIFTQIKKEFERKNIRRIKLS